MKTGKGKLIINNREIEVTLRLRQSRLTPLGNSKYRAQETWIASSDIGLAFGHGESTFYDGVEMGSPGGMWMRNSALDLVTYAAQTEAINRLKDIYTAAL